MNSNLQFDDPFKIHSNGIYAGYIRTTLQPLETLESGRSYVSTKIPAGQFFFIKMGSFSGLILNNLKTNYSLSLSRFLKDMNAIQDV